MPAIFRRMRGWSGGAMVLGKLPVPGRPTNLDKSRARAYCACNRCGWGCLDIFSLLYLFSFLSRSLWETARYRLKYCLEGPLSPKQPTKIRRIIFSLSAEPAIVKPTYIFEPFARMLDNERFISFVGVTSCILAHRCNNFCWPSSDR